MHIYDFAIIGGGIAGFFAAIQLYEADANVQILILEKNSEPLKKLLITGSGSCNFSHTGTIDDFLLKYGANGKFLRSAFHHFFTDDLLNFFDANNLSVLCRDDGKYFPSSMKANDIKKLFLDKAKHSTQKYNSAVKKIVKNQDDIFEITTETIVYYAKNVVIATGGCSFPDTGSSGDGYEFASNFGHTIEPLKPALANIQCENHLLTIFSGIGFSQLRISHYRSKKKLNQYDGALLITHKGLSGPIIIDNSRYFEKGDVLKIRFIAESTEGLEKSLRENNNTTFNIALKKYEIPKKIIQFLAKLSEIDETKKICEISNKKLTVFCENLLQYKVVIAKIESFATCMATSGGVSLHEISPKTFESKVIKNLYFLGEVLDIDGDSGGYNLQAIFSQCSLFSHKKTNIDIEKTRK